MSLGLTELFLHNCYCEDLIFFQTKTEYRSWKVDTIKYLIAVLQTKVKDGKLMAEKSRSSWQCS